MVHTVYQYYMTIYTGTRTVYYILYYIFTNTLCTDYIICII